MADVRLTATNPEDSSVVPVACDAGGRLLLQELPAFDGNVDGDLTVTGKGSFAGGKSIIGNDGSAQFAQGAVDIYANGTVEFTQDVTFDGSAKFAAGDIKLNADGSAEFADAVKAKFLGTENTDQSHNVNINVSTGALVSSPYSVAVATFILYRDGSCQWGGTQGNPLIAFDGTDGSAEFAGEVTFASNKAGFTAEGYLWCTTRRGDTVVLDATSNGLASWVEFTPTSRIDDLRDRLDANRGDTGEMPADTP